MKNILPHFNRILVPLQLQDWSLGNGNLLGRKKTLWYTLAHLKGESTCFPFLYLLEIFWVLNLRLKSSLTL